MSRHGAPYKLTRKPYVVELYHAMVVLLNRDELAHMGDTKYAQMFVTREYSVSEREGNAKCHVDERDKSMALVVGWQDPTTPDVHAAHFAASTDGAALVRSYRGGFAMVFDGRRPHGAIPPAMYSKEYPWFGCALVVANKVPTLC